jgi:N-acetylglucosamine kinase-like BadF-type ATPase
MVTPAFVGVDNGGTWIRLIGLDKKGRRVWSLKKRSPTVQDLPAFLKTHLKRFHGKLDGLAVGSRGVWKKIARQSVKRKLQGLAKNIVVMSDVEAAWAAAFRSQGIVVIAGTGSIAYGRTSTGRFARAGGLGPEKGDEGSGYWIGKEWLRRTKTLPIFRKTQVRTIAALAPTVLRRARRGNRVAVEIVRLAQWELGQLVRTLLHDLKLKSAPVACAGSVLQDLWFRRGFWRALSPLHVTFRAPRTDAATALAGSIISHASR